MTHTHRFELVKLCHINEAPELNVDQHILSIEKIDKNISKMTTRVLDTMKKEEYYFFNSESFSKKLGKPYLVKKFQMTVSNHLMKKELGNELTFIADFTNNKNIDLLNHKIQM